MTGEGFLPRLRDILLRTVATAAIRADAQRSAQHPSQAVGQGLLYEDPALSAPREVTSITLRTRWR